MNHCRVCLALVILLNLTVQQALMAHPVTNHVVPVAELHSRFNAQSARRIENIQEVQRLLNQPLIQKELGRLVPLERVELALATLDDETLNELAAESREFNDQIEAGMATWGWVTIAGIVAFVIIVIIGYSFID
jgi:hypothetical protein